MSAYNVAVGSNVIHEVIDKVKGQHYQVACLKVFEATHPGGTVDALHHPNQYFQVGVLTLFRVNCVFVEVEKHSCLLH
jgi:hypothetical protein